MCVPRIVTFIKTIHSYYLHQNSRTPVPVNARQQMTMPRLGLNFFGELATFERFGQTREEKKNCDLIYKDTRGILQWYRVCQGSWTIWSEKHPPWNTIAFLQSCIWCNARTSEPCSCAYFFVRIINFLTDCIWKPQSLAHTVFFRNGETNQKQITIGSTKVRFFPQMTSSILATMKNMKIIQRGNPIK